VNALQHYSSTEILLSFIFVFVVGCADTEHVTTVTVMPPDRITCETEARQLSEPVAVYPAPKSGLTPIVKLDKGRFVYRCEQQAEWLGVMFPAVGEKIDCAEREPEKACSLGWIRRETKMEIFG
jgi:hypothetical protein